MFKQSNIVLVTVLSALAALGADVVADCNPIGAWTGTLESDTQLGGSLTNWIFHADRRTGGEWTMNTVGGYTAGSDNASGMWICFSGRLLATYTGTAVESGSGSESDYTLELDGMTEGDTASGQYTIVFDNLLWEDDSGTWDMTGDAVSNHVFWIEIEHGLDFDDPANPNYTEYEFWFDIGTDDTVERVEVLSPGGRTFEIPRLANQWDDINQIWTNWEYDSESGSYEWEYEASYQDISGFDVYGDGTYVVKIHYFGGFEQQTSVWYGIPGTTDAIGQPLQEPKLIYPSHKGGNITSPVTFTWEAITDPEAFEIFMFVEKNDAEWEEYLFGPSETSSDPIALTDGVWEAEFGFGPWYETEDNGDGIAVGVGKYCESDYEFAVGGPWIVYEVWGGNTDYTAEPQSWEYYYSIDRQSDYQKLDRTAGQFGQTATFFGDQQYSYYVIAARETLLVDSIRSQYDSYYWGPYPSGNTSDPGNITGLPDGQYATVGEHPSGGTYSGFVIISNQWNCRALTVITDIPGISVSGTVTDKATSLPLANMRVNCQHLDTETWTEVRTEGSGFYELTHLPPGKVEINVRPEQGSGYGGLKAELELTGDVNDLNFALPLAGRISGTVKDSNNNPVPNLWVYANEYESNLYYNGDHTDANGEYEITALPPGTYRVEAGTWDTDYIRQFYDHQTDWDKAARVSVTAGEETADIDFTLMVGASISGFVKNLTGDGIENVRIDCSVNEVYYAHGITTDSNGFYKARGLLPGYSYRVVAYPPAETDYMISRIYVDGPEPNDYTAEDIILHDGALTVAGRVTDKATGTPLAGIWVSCHLDDIDVWGGGCNTGPDGGYILTNLPPGWAQIRAEPEQGSGYAGIGTELELTGDLSGLDFALPPAATLSGKVIDIETAEPLENIEVAYWSDKYAVWQNDFTDSDGRFTLTNLPPGIAEIMARPEADTGYAWSSSWESSWVYLDEGQEYWGRFIALQKGALVYGYIVNADDTPASGIDYDYEGRACGGDGQADADGYYEIILPSGDYIMGPDNDEFGVLYGKVTVTDINTSYSVPDITVYSEDTGGEISGTINNPGGHARRGDFLIVAFEAGTEFSPDTWYTIRPVTLVDQTDTGPFTVNSLPPGNYDIYLTTVSETPEEIESLAVRDSALNVPVGAVDVSLDYDSEGGTIRGIVENVRGEAVLGACVLLTDSAVGEGFAGFGDVDKNGEYAIYNVPAGAYTATAVHGKYVDSSTTIQVLDGETTYVDSVIMSFSGEKEGADLNGDGIVDLSDMALFAGQWLDSGEVDSNFDRQGSVDMADFSRFADNWYWQAIWPH